MNKMPPLMKNIFRAKIILNESVNLSMNLKLIYWKYTQNI